MFEKNSTRTRVSFGSAFNLLGGEVRETTGFEHSAIAKGESLYDTARGHAPLPRTLADPGRECRIEFQRPPRQIGVHQRLVDIARLGWLARVRGYGRDSSGRGVEYSEPGPGPMPGVRDHERGTRRARSGLWGIHRTAASATARSSIPAGDV